MSSQTPPTQHSMAIRWDGQTLALLDQRALPHEENWLPLHSADDTAQAIQDMVVRGAPAIGIAAAYGLAMAVQQLGEQATEQALEPAIHTLAESRPTAVNLFWALERLRRCAANLTGDRLITRLKEEAVLIHREDMAANQRMGDWGVTLLPQNATVYTHCNTGALATGGHGTALGIIRTAHQQGRLLHAYAGETRPWLQGSRLTAWELLRDDIPVTLVADSAAGHLMAQGKIDAVLVGADRITANGDAANKIGTYNLAVLAKHHGIPFIVAAPLSTIDSALPDGSHIAIEQRHADEVRQVQGKALAPEGCPAYNPAFDVTPASLISAIVTERGVIQSPSTESVSAHLTGESA